MGRRQADVLIPMHMENQKTAERTKLLAQIDGPVH